MTRTALLRLHNEAGNLRQLDLSGRRKLLSRQAFLRGKYPEADPGRLSFSPPIMPVHERYWSWVEEKRITIIADPAIEEDRVAVAREGITELLTEVGLMINVEIQTMPLLEHFQWTQENADQKCSKKPMDIAVVDHAFDFRTQNLFPPGGLVFLTDYPGIIANYLVTFYGFGAFDPGMAFICLGGEKMYERPFLMRLVKHEVAHLIGHRDHCWMARDKFVDKDIHHRCLLHPWDQLSLSLCSDCLDWTREFWSGLGVKTNKQYLNSRGRILLMINRAKLKLL